MDFEKQIRKIIEESNNINKYVKHLGLPDNMCDICKFLFMCGQGYSLGFGPSNTKTEKTKEGFLIHFEQQFKWISPKEIKQGFIN